MALRVEAGTGQDAISGGAGGGGACEWATRGVTLAIGRGPGSTQASIARTGELRPLTSWLGAGAGLNEMRPNSHHRTQELEDVLLDKEDALHAVAYPPQVRVCARAREPRATENSKFW